MPAAGATRGGGRDAPVLLEQLHRCCPAGLESASRPDLVGVRLACDEYRAADHAEFLYAADTGLGELAARKVQHPEVERTPPDPEARGYRRLATLSSTLRR